LTASSPTFVRGEPIKNLWFLIGTGKRGGLLPCPRPEVGEEGKGKEASLSFQKKRRKPPPSIPDLLSSTY
jgi:hypothetical protein